MGSFQASNLSVSEPIQLVAEEKVVFGLNAKAVSQLTLSKIRKVYSRVDNKSIAKQLGMSSHENATPIRILHNSAGHLAGPSRTLGGVVIGYLGVRVFCSRPVATVVCFLYFIIFTDIVTKLLFLNFELYIHYFRENK